MSSNEEYLENLLQSMMDGKVAGPSKNDMNDSGRKKSAIEMLTGEEPEQALFSEELNTDNGPEAADTEAVPLDADLSMEEFRFDDADLGESAIEDMDLGSIDMEAMAQEDAIMDVVDQDDLAPGDIGLEDTVEDSGFGDIDDMALEEHGLEDMVIDDFAMEDMNTEESAMDAVSPDDMGLEDIDLGSIGLEDTGLDDIGLNDTDMGDLGLNDISMDDIALEEHGLENMVAEEPALEEMNLDDMGLGDMELDDIGIDDMALEEHSLDDMVIDDADLEEMNLDDTAGDDLSLDDLDLGEMSLEDSSAEEFSLDDMSMSEEMSESSNMALEESGFDDMSEDFALEESGMDDLAEINNLLEQSGQDEEIDDEMLALLESVSDSGEDDMTGEENNEFSFFPGDDDGNDGMASIEGLDMEEETPPEEEKKKKKGKWKKKNKKAEKNAGEMADSQAGAGDIEGGEGTNEGKPDKKPGAFARFLAFLTETDEDDEENAEGTMQAGEASGENAELLAELSAEDKKKGKKEKKEKKKKEKKGKGKKASGGEEGGEESTARKKKKPKKEKKVKEVDEEALKADTGKKLSRKKIIPVILFCATIMLCIIVFTIIIPDHMQKRDARIAYDMGNYEDVYDLLYGKDLNEEEEVLLHKSTIVMKMERKLESYQNYLKLGGHELEALNALVQGVALYYELLPEAGEYSVMGELGEKYQQILVILSDRYGLYETDVMDIIYSENDEVYTQKIMSALYGISYPKEEEQFGGVADVLPEEQEILDGLPEAENNITDDISSDSFEESADDISDETSDDAAEGTAASDGEVKYIEPVSVEVHQNN